VGSHLWLTIARILLRTLMVHAQTQIVFALRTECWVKCEEATLGEISTEDMPAGV